MQQGRRERGRFITLEGPDGAGKSSQADRLVSALRDAGSTVRQVREPGGTPLGEAVRELLMAAAPHDARSDALLFNAARATLVAEVIRPALERGEIVVCDRYADSTLAYQGHGGGLDVAELDRINAWSTGGLVPDLTILFDVPVEQGLARRAGGPRTGRTRFEDPAYHDAAFHERVRAGYRRMAAADPARWRVIDASRSPDRVAAELLALVTAWLEKDEAVPARA
ncbi:MAG TPA: dTMP kinase [Candidatus Dormibacteraeota bacterium]|nr:dTMP kinase [Candidatus Dormibacteraeota bacterium]